MKKLSILVTICFLLIGNSCFVSSDLESHTQIWSEQKAYSRALGSMYKILHDDYPSYRAIYVSQEPDISLKNVPELLRQTDTSNLDCLALGSFLNRDGGSDLEDVQFSTKIRKTEVNDISIYPIQMPKDYMANLYLFPDSMNKFDSLWLRRSRAYQETNRLVILFGVERVRVELDTEGHALRWELPILGVAHPEAYWLYTENQITGTHQIVLVCDTRSYRRK